MEKLFVPLKKEKHSLTLKPAPPVQDVLWGVLTPEERAFFHERNRQSIGRWAEEKAQAFLKAQGLKIVARNVRDRFSELDIVCRDGGELVIAEVRCRREGAVISAFDSMGIQKWRKLTRGAELFVVKSGWEGGWRIDLVTVDVSDGQWRLSWLKYLEMDGGGRDDGC